MQHLLIDIGNSRTKMGIIAHAENQYIEQDIFSASTDYVTFFNREIEKIEQWIASKQFGKCILSSVIQTPQSIIDLIRISSTLTQLNPQTKLPIEISYKSPETLGPDRVAVSVAAAVLYPKAYCLVVNLGTCITFDFVHQNKFLGGNIVPGIQMRYRSMHEMTAKLPLVDLPNHGGLYGQSTMEALQLGVLNGVIFEIKGYIRALKEQTTDPIQLIITGGDSVWLSTFLDIPHVVRKYMVLIGLNEILKIQA